MNQSRLYLFLSLLTFIFPSLAGSMARTLGTQHQSSHGRRTRFLHSAASTAFHYVSRQRLSGRHHSGNFVQVGLPTFLSHTFTYTHTCTWAHKHRQVRAHARTQSEGISDAKAPENFPSQSHANTKIKPGTRTHVRARTHLRMRTCAHTHRHNSFLPD